MHYFNFDVELVESRRWQSENIITSVVTVMMHVLPLPAESAGLFIRCRHNRSPVLLFGHYPTIQVDESPRLSK
jgi:hypothetical protein